MGQTIARIVEQLSNILDATAATVPNAALLWDQLAALPVLEPVTPEQMAAWQAEAARRDEARGLATAPKQPIATAVVTSTSPLGVLIGRRNDGKPPWTFIAGEVEPGEEPEFAAERETKEETGLEVRAVRRLGERIHPKTGRDMIYIACAPTVGTDIFVGDPIELAEVKWASLAEADELLPGMFGPVHEYLSQELAEGD
jgi:8-oxo-dGTP pyrophosphatase MutT (NUDIX family)